MTLPGWLKKAGQRVDQQVGNFREDLREVSEDVRENIRASVEQGRNRRAA